MVKLNDNVVSVDAAGQCLVIDPRTGRYLAANRVAYEMLVVLVTTQSEADATERLLATLDVDPTTLASDFSEFQQMLIDLELATGSGQGTSVGC